MKIRQKNARGVKVAHNSDAPPLQKTPSILHGHSAYIPYNYFLCPHRPI